jgi:hypothetical protein
MGTMKGNDIMAIQPKVTSKYNNKTYQNTTYNSDGKAVVSKEEDNSQTINRPRKYGFAFESKKGWLMLLCSVGLN